MPWGSRVNGFETRFERMELKYMVDESMAARLREAIAPYCVSDSHNDIQTNGRRPGYPISSLYLDSPGLAFHRAKERGDSERLKLRVRTYEGSPIASLELKRRVSEVIDKTRVVVERDQAERAAQGMVDPEDPEARRFLMRFARIAAESGAEPTLHVRYEREAYISTVDDYARVTFDRRIEVQRASGWSLDPDSSRWSRFDDVWRPDLMDNSILLELKCQSSVPWWMTELVREFGLQRISFSKYSTGIHLTGREGGQMHLGRRAARPLS